MISFFNKNLKILQRLKIISYIWKYRSRSGLFETSPPNLLIFFSLLLLDFIVKLPFSLAKIMGATNDVLRLIFGDLVPAFLTLAQVKSLETDNLVGRKSDKFSDFGIVPKKLEIVLPTIVGRFNQG